MSTSNDQVTTVTVEVGQVSFDPKKLPCTVDAERMIDYPVEIGGKSYNVTCLSMGNPHCVVFTDHVEALNLDEIGPQFENAAIFPERVNTEFVRVVNSTTLRMRCFERGSGETMACGTGACAAVVAAVENGHCAKDTDVTVQVNGGTLVVRYSESGVTLHGNAELVYKGSLEI